MKKVLLVSIVVALSFHIETLSAQAKNQTSPVIGAWKLISAETNYSDTTVRSDSSQRMQIKIVTPERFMFMIMDPQTDSLLAATTGRVILKGNNYTEVIEQTSIKGIRGGAFTYPVNVKGNRWFLKGTIGETKLNEVWMKLE